jgi:hypothetical protein
VILGDVRGVMHWWFVTGLATLAAGLGHRYGACVVAATVMALTQSS